MNHDLELIGQWAHDWKMSFNPDPQKQAVELLLSKKGNGIDHPVVLFNDIPVKKAEEHKHLGLILDKKLSFSAHIKAAISKTRKGIGLLKYLSKYLPRHTLNELYKLYVRPHLDYGDVIYHIPSKVCEFSQNIFLPSLMEKLESFTEGTCPLTCSKSMMMTQTMTETYFMQESSCYRLRGCKFLISK